MQIKRNRFTVALSTVAMASSLCFASNAFADTTGYQNMFISYFSPQNAKAMASYASSQKLGGYIMWEAQGDMDPATDPSQSLLAALNPNKDDTTNIMGYWADWSVYNTGHGQPIASYPIPGSSPSSGSGTETNQDLVDKIPYMSSLAYAFLEAQTTNNNLSTNDIGTIYFNDPWSDLTPTDSFCQNGNNMICSFVPQKKGKAFAASAKMGNFEAFAQLPQKYSNLKTVISIGGYSHDDSFESIFTADGGVNTDYENNFVNSATSIMNNYKIDGIDLDYENPNMTPAQSQSFEKLVEALNAKLTGSQYITLAILANPAYINGTENGGITGFASGVLQTIAGLSHVKTIDLMTYDFHGAFDYNPSNNDQGRTGFITNNYMPTNAPQGYNPQFSVDTSVQALEKAGVPASKVVIGVPAYGRALANVQAGDLNGLFQPITSAAIIPRGDMDTATCNQAIYPLSSNSCSGIFSYSFIIKNMLNNGFTAKDWIDDSGNVSNGTTAYATSWQPAAASDYTLEVTNTGTASSFGFTISNGSASFDGNGYYVTKGEDKTYNNANPPAPTAIENQDNLSVSWTDWAGTFKCSGTFNFDGNYHIMINPDTKACAIEKM